MPLGPVLTVALIVITALAAVLALLPLRRGISSDRQRAAVGLVALSSWSVLWPVVPDWGLADVGGMLFLLGLWLVPLPVHATGLLAGVGLARHRGWGRWLARAWALLSLCWSAFFLTSAGASQLLANISFSGAVILGSLVALLVGSLLTLFFLARDRGAPITPAWTPLPRAPIWSPVGDRTCPNCGALVAKDRKRFCNNCGGDLATWSARQGSRPNQPR